MLFLSEGIFEQMWPHRSANWRRGFSGTVVFVFIVLVLGMVFLLGLRTLMHYRQVKLSLRKHQLEMTQDTRENEDVAMPPVLEEFEPISDVPAVAESGRALRELEIEFLKAYTSLFQSHRIDRNKLKAQRERKLVEETVALSFGVQIQTLKSGTQGNGVTHSSSRASRLKGTFSSGTLTR